MDQVVVLSLVASSQVVVGIVIWICCTRSSRFTQLELVAMGMILGPITCTVLDQIFLLTQIRGAGTPVALFIVAGAFLAKKRWKDVVLQRDSPMEISSIIVAVLVGLSIDEFYSVPSLIASSIAIFYLGLMRHDRQKYGVIFLASLLSGLFVRAALRLSVGSTNVLFPLISGIASDDQVKSEQLSFSLAQWGFSTNSAAINLPIKFHWLSLGWAGTLMGGGKIEPFVVSLHFVPLFGFIGVSVALTHLAKNIGLKTWGVLVAPFLLLAGMNSDGNFRFFFVLTTTNLIPHLWILGLIIALMKYHQEKKELILPIILLLPSAILLGKGPYGVVVGAALLGTSLMNLMSGKRVDQKLTWASLGGLLIMAITFIAFLRSPLTDSYYFSFSELIRRFPFPLMTSRFSGFVSLILGCGIIGIFIALRFSWISQVGALCSSQLGGFIVIGSVAGTASFIFKQIGSETYFVNASMTISVIGFLICLGKFENQFEVVSKSLGLTSLASLFLVMIFLRAINSPVLVSYLLIFLTGIFASIVLSKRLRVNFRATLFVVCGLLPAVIGLSNIRFRSSNIEEYLPKSEVKIYEWVRENTDPDSIFITDRDLCPKTVRCKSGMPVAASLTRRRFLIEGARTLTPTRLWDEPYPLQLSDAANLTLAFVKQPNPVILQALYNRGVKYAIVSAKAFQGWQNIEGVTELYTEGDLSVIVLVQNSQVEN